MSQPVRSRDLGAFLVSVLVGINLLVFALSGYSLYQSRQQFELRARTMTQNIAGALDQRISASMEKIDLALRTVADELERQLAGKGIDAPAMNAFLARHEGRVPEIDGIRVADAQGLHILGKGVVGKDKVGIADRDYFIHLRDHDDRALYVSKPVTGRIAKKQVMVAAQRYNHPDGRFAGVIIGAITVDHFTRLLSGFNLGANGTLTLRYADLGLITRYPPLPNETAGQLGNSSVSVEGRKLFDAGVRAATFHTGAGSDGRERIFTFRHLDKVPLIVNAGAAREDYLADWIDEVYRTTAFALGFLALSLLSGTFLLRLLGEAKANMRLLRDSESRYRQSFEVNPAVKLVIDAKSGEIVDANPAAVAFYGYSREQLLAMRINDINCLGEDSLQEKLAAAAAGRIQYFDFRHRLASGEIRDVGVYSGAARVGQRDLLYSIVHDVTDRKRAEREQQRLNRALRLLSDCNLAIVHAEDEQALLPDVCRLVADTGGYLMCWIGIAVHDAEKSVRSVARSAGADGYLESIRVSWDETREIGRGPTGTAIRTGRTQINQSYLSNPLMAPWRQAALEHGYQSSIALPLLTREQTLGALTIYAADPEAFTADEVALLQELARNVAFGLQALRARQRREEADAALRESAARYRTLLDNLPQIIWQKDGDSVYVGCNLAYARSLGITPVELPGKTDHDFYPAELAEKYRQDDKAVMADGRIKTLDETWLADGKELFVRTTKVPLRDDAGRVYGTLGIAEDITLQKEARRALERNKEQLEALVVARTEELAAARDVAEAATRAKSAFLANMSHEIRTPLAIIIGLGNVLKQKLSDPTLTKRLAQLCATADHLTAVVNDILDLSKIDAGHLALEEKDFRLGAVLDTVTNLTGELAREQGLTLSVEAPPALRETLLHGDALRLGQVLINLAGNAVKFTERGSVVVSVAVLAESSSELRLRFAVSDTGIGIAAEDQTRLFLAYEQADNSLARAHGGTGLGLAISQKLVALMGGSIGLDSRPGCGSTFSFDLSFGRGADLAEPTPALTAMPNFRGARVLVAEDHPLNQEIMLDLLESFGCEAEFAGDGVEAIECARSADYDLILMDVRMPRLDGLAATRAIRALPRYQHTPILAVTAGAFSEDREHCLEAGMSGHISKPFTLVSLVNCLKQWLPEFAEDVPDQPARDEGLELALDAVPGLDAGCLVRRTARHPEGYIALLRRYVDLHQEDMARLRQHLASGEAEAARRIVHQLHGSSGFVGAKRIAALVSEIATALSAGADATSLAAVVDDCAAELASLAAAVRAIAPVATAGAV